MTNVKKVVSFDIGTKHFAYSISTFDLEDLLALRAEYKALPKSLQRKTTGPMSPELQRILNKMFKLGNLINCECENLRSEKYDRLDMETRKNLIKFLDDRQKDIQDCDIVLIEQQYFSMTGRGKKFQSHANMEAIKFAEFLLSYFMVVYPYMQVEICPAKNKTAALGMPKMGDRERKEYADSETARILELRCDDRASMFEKKRGKDKTNDKADTILQLEAWKYLNYIAK